MAEQMKQNKAGEMTAKQAIPAGYKQTEVGVIPEDWDVKRISDIADVFSGGTPNRENPKYWDGNVPWITTTLIDGKDIIEANEFITEAGVVGSSVKWCRPGAILMAMYGQGKTRGKVAILSFNATINQACAAIELKDLTSSVFVLHMLIHMYKIIRELSNAGGQENLSGFIIKNLRVPYPPKQERIAIANSLSDTDALISGLEQLIAKKQAIKTATIQQLLTGRTRLPQFAQRPDGSPKGYKLSELGDIPEDWEIKQIIQFTDCTAGGTPSTSIASYWGGEHPWMSSGELHLKRVFDVSVRITDEGLGNSSTKYVPADSVLIGLAGQGKTRGTVAIAKIPLCTNQSIASIFPSAEHCPEFLFYNLDSRYEELRELSTGDGGRGGLNLAIIRRLKVIFPDKTEQSAIANVLSDMDSELTELEQKLAKARDLKQGMMQQLLTGRIRLPLPKEA